MPTLPPFPLSIFPHLNDNGMFAAQPAHYWPLFPGLWKDLVLVRFVIRKLLKCWGLQWTHFCSVLEDISLGHDFQTLVGIGDQTERNDAVVNRTFTRMSMLGEEKTAFNIPEWFFFIKNIRAFSTFLLPFPLLPKDFVVTCSQPLVLAFPFSPQKDHHSISFTYVGFAPLLGALALLWLLFLSNFPPFSRASQRTVLPDHLTLPSRKP